MTAWRVWEQVDMIGSGQRGELARLADDACPEEVGRQITTVLWECMGKWNWLVIVRIIGICKDALSEGLLGLSLACSLLAAASAESNSKMSVPVLTENSNQQNLPRFRAIRDLATPGTVSAVLWNSDGTKLAASSLLASDDSLGLGFPSPFGNRITIWDDQGHVFKTITRAKPFFQLSDRFAFVGNDRQIAAPSSIASSDLALSVFDLDTGEIVRELAGRHPDRPRNVNAARVLVASPNQLILAAVFGRASAQPVALYSAQDWRKIADLPESLKNGAEAPEALSFSQDGRLLAVGRVDGVVLVYDVFSKQVIRQLDAFERGSGIISAMAFNFDAKMIAVAARMYSTERKLSNGSTEIIPPKNLVRVLRVEDAGLTAMYGEPFYPADAVDWTRDGKYVAFITANRTLHLWDPFRPALTERTIDLGGEAFSLAFSPNGLSLAVGVGNAVRLITLEP